MEILLWDELKKTGTTALNRALFEGGTAVTIGAFDGVHFGHKILFEAVLKADKSLKKGVVSFINPPKKRLAGDKYAGNILTLRLKLKKLAEFGFDFVTLIDFSASFTKIEGSIFIEDLAKTVCMKYLVVGEDFACGHRRDTGLSELRLLAEQLDFGFDSIKRVCKNRHAVSSTDIRRAIYKADFTLTEKLLGYPFLLDSIGVQWCKTTDGFKTFLSCFTQIIPHSGKYKVRILLTDNSVYKGFFKIEEVEGFLVFEKPKVLHEKNVSSKEIDSIIFVNEE